jgi:hypothetical protein
MICSRHSASAHDLAGDGVSVHRALSVRVGGGFARSTYGRQKCVEAVDDQPWAKSLRLHQLTGYAKPAIWKIDVYANHSWQITFEMEGTTARLVRLATHKKIDRDPR